MFNGYKIVCVTPAGRRRYLRLLSNQILKSTLVDEYHLWKNTTDISDIQFLHELCTTDTRVRVIEPTSIQPGSNSAIKQFYQHCIDVKSIYIRFDDDIVYIEPDFFTKFLKFRIENPEYFVVFPNVINNAVCTYIQSARGKIRPAAWVHPWCMDLTTWGNSHFAEQLHRAFLQSVEVGHISDWYFGARLIALSRFSINCMAWFGSEFAKFGGEVLGDEEEFLSVIKPTQSMRSNCIYGDTLVSHFAFHPQRAYLDTTDLLQLYESVSTSIPRADGASPASMDIDLWTPRLIKTIRAFATASKVDLGDVNFVANYIRSAGLIRDNRLPYGNDNCHMNTESVGLWQIPIQLARFMLQISKYEIKRVLDIGTGSGWTISLITAYLARFNEDIQVTTIDANNFFYSYSDVKDLLPLDFQAGKTSETFRNKSFDLVFIDGNHSYGGCRTDYQNVGHNAPICGFHDIQDRFVRGLSANQGGVPRFWEELKCAVVPSVEIFEYLDHSNNDKIMGIGLLVKGDMEEACA